MVTTVDGKFGQTLSNGGIIRFTYATANIKAQIFSQFQHHGGNQNHTGEYFEQGNSNVFVVLMTSALSCWLNWLANIVWTTAFLMNIVFGHLFYILLRQCFVNVQQNPGNDALRVSSVLSKGNFIDVLEWQE